MAEYYLCILDFEATCWENDRNDAMQEIIEFPSILYQIHKTREGFVAEYVSEFAEYVSPQLCPVLSEFCTELTGITQEQVDSAATFPEVYKRHFKWLQEHIPHDQMRHVTFATCGNWDLRDMLPIETARHNPSLPEQNPYTNWVNVKDPFTSTRPAYQKKSGKSMMNMLRALKIPHQGRHHSGIDDCRNIAAICVHLIEQCGVDFRQFVQTNDHA